MENYDLESLLIQMNQEILLLIDSTLNDLALTIALSKILRGKDELDEDERFSDETYRLTETIQNDYQSFFHEATSQSRAFARVLQESEIIPLNLQSDINLMLEYKADSLDISSSPFSPYAEDKDSFYDAEYEFCFRLLAIYRTKSWINDILQGIQDYGVDPYLVPEGDNEDAINILDGIYDLDNTKIASELSTYLLQRGDGNDDLDRIGITQLLDKMSKKHASKTKTTHTQKKGAE